MQMSDIILILRRRIGDTLTPTTYDDNTLTGYIEDSVAQVELEWFQQYDASNGLFNRDVDKNSATVFAIKAHFLLALSIKDQADRNNFLMKKGRLTLDNRNQSKDHLDTIEAIDKEYKRALYRAKNNGALQGIRME